MAKATIKVGSATIQIEGTASEVEILVRKFTAQENKKKDSPKDTPEKQLSTNDQERAHEVTRALSSLKDWGQISERILDKRIGKQISRILLCLLGASETNNPWLTAKEISLVTRELGLPIAAANVSKAARTAARNMIMTDKSGGTARLRISRIGSAELKQWIGGTNNAPH